VFSDSNAATEYAVAKMHAYHAHVRPLPLRDLPDD
jgi:hypothetical protein